MRIILLGAPGAGKGTQAQFIINRYNIPHISTGNILRGLVNRPSKFGPMVTELMQAGKLVPNELVIKLVKERIKQNDCGHGFLLDGFPRTLRQAHVMQKECIRVDYVFNFEIPEKLIIDRIIGRRLHASSGRLYHVKFSPPRQEGRDDITGEPLIIRPDDHPQIVSKRLMEYQQHTTSLINYYRTADKQGTIRYFVLDGTRQVAEINADIAAIMGQ